MTDSLSAELKAMVQLESALKDLQDEERARVMQWAGSRFAVAIQPKLAAKGSGISSGAESALGEGEEGGGDATEHTELATLYDAAGPTTDMEKALVAAYWIQVREDNADFDAQTVNTQLKHLGHQIGNVTRALEGLKAQKPALIVQTRKEGSTRQARKRFKVTVEGRKVVERMLKAPE